MTDATKLNEIIAALNNTTVTKHTRLCRISQIVHTPDRTPPKTPTGYGPAKQGMPPPDGYTNPYHTAYRVGSTQWTRGDDEEWLMGIDERGDIWNTQRLPEKPTTKEYWVFSKLYSGHQRLCIRHNGSVPIHNLPGVIIEDGSYIFDHFRNPTVKYQQLGFQYVASVRPGWKAIFVRYDSC